MAPIWAYQICLNGILMIDLQVLKRTATEIALASARDEPGRGRPRQSVRRLLPRGSDLRIRALSIDYLDDVHRVPDDQQGDEHRKSRSGTLDDSARDALFLADALAGGRADFGRGRGRDEAGVSPGVSDGGASAVDSGLRRGGVRPLCSCGHGDQWRGKAIRGRPDCRRLAARGGGCKPCTADASGPGRSDAAGSGDRDRDWNGGRPPPVGVGDPSLVWCFHSGCHLGSSRVCVSRGVHGCGQPS